MSNKMVFNVLSVKRWRITDKDTGEINEGYTVYVGQDSEDHTGNTLGWDVVKFTAPLKLFEQLKGKRFPSECEVDVSLKMGAGGKASMQVLGIDVLS